MRPAAFDGERHDDVYAALDGTGVNLVGGRNPAVGVAGFTLGGGAYGMSPGPCYLTCYGIGYSWKSNQYGLAVSVYLRDFTMWLTAALQIDTLAGVNLVLPNGTLATANHSHHPDLFFSLKGGFNNYVGLSSAGSPGV